MIKRLLVKCVSEMQSLLTWLPWATTYLRFQIRGHSPAWNIFTHLNKRERLFLYWLGLEQPPGSTFVEIGSYVGASACFLAAAASEIGGGTVVHCVDTWQNEGMTEGLRDTWAEFKHNTEGYAKFIVPHIGLSAQVAETFDSEIDLLFVDGDHSYEGCKADVLAWTPKLKRGGVIVMHDFGWAAGVQKVVSEIIQPIEITKGIAFENSYWTRI